MAVCRVISKTEGWNVGDHVEASGERLKSLVDKRIVVVVTPDPKPIVEKPVDETEEEVVVEPVKNKKPKKGGV